jgi:hypothetical protein
VSELCFRVQERSPCFDFHRCLWFRFCAGFDPAPEVPSTGLRVVGFSRHRRFCSSARPGLRSPVLFLHQGFVAAGCPPSALHLPHALRSSPTPAHALGGLQVPVAGFGFVLLNRATNEGFPVFNFVGCRLMVTTT